jgi:hypothetical protein
MDSKEVKSIVDIIRDAETKELVIVSLFLLPILLGAWSVFLNSLTFLDQHEGWKFLVLCLLLFIYIGGLIYMKLTDTMKDKLKRARFHVETSLKKRGGNRASFDAIRNEVDESYSDEFLKKLIDINPEVFGRCQVIRDDGNRPGITLVSVEFEEA